MKSIKNGIILCLLVLPLSAQGQFYNNVTTARPSGLNWQQLKTEHFRIIFPFGEDSLAYRSAAILESQYDAASALTGGTLKNFPVILNNYNDFSNGFVNSFNFRSEFDLSAFKGKEMNPRSGNWLETVLPHELVHATHFNVQQPFKDKKISIPNLISFLSPDLARTFHGMPPVGLHEGLAVHHETNAVLAGGGRGNHPYYTNRFNANFSGPDRWNMGQTLIPSAYTQPYNRHYIAGYTFVDWLQNEYGEDFAKESIRFHYHNFFMGYGFALRKITGKWPWELYDLYEADMASQERMRLSGLEYNTTHLSRVLDTPFKGEEARSPKWLSNDELIFYGSFYNARIGFYTYDLSSERVNILKETFSVSDFNYDINDKGELYYSKYSRDPLYAGVYITDVGKFDLQSGKSESLTDNAHVYAPATNGATVLAIQGEGSSARIVELVGDNTVPVASVTNGIPVSIAFNPKNPNEVAVVVKRRGVQALWITKVNELSSTLNADPTLAFAEASIYDAQWHPSGDRLLFTMDAAPAMNIYEYDTGSGAITQITNAPYNAFEASYSPDGNAIAYVIQSNSERKLAVLERQDFYDRLVLQEELLVGEELAEELNRPLLGNEKIKDIASLPVQSYGSDWSWLKPRAVYPVIKEQSDAYQYGVGLSSIDALSRQAYSAEITGIQNRLWYDVTYTNKMFYPGIELSAYSDPSFFVTRDPGTGELVSLMRQDRGFSASMPFEYTFRGDTRLSSIYFSPKLSAEQFKYYDLLSNDLSDFATRYKASAFTQLSLGVLNLRRDVQPSAGVSFFGLLEHTLNQPSVRIQLPGSLVGTTFDYQWSAYYGVFGFLSPLRKWNQSLRLDLQFLQQSVSPIYSNSTIVPMGFESGAFVNYNTISGTGTSDLARVSAKYVIPLFYPDTGGLTLPLYLSSVYLSTFSHTLTDMDAPDLIEASRTIVGAGLHIQFKVSNISFDLGVGLAYEPTRNRTQFIFGQL